MGADGGGCGGLWDVGLKGGIELVMEVAVKADVIRLVCYSTHKEDHTRGKKSSSHDRDDEKGLTGAMVT